MNELLTKKELNNSIKFALQDIEDDEVELHILRAFHEKWVEVHTILNEKGRCKEAEIASQELIELHHSLTRH